MTLTKILNIMLKPFGMRARSFLIDYRDDSGNDYNKEICSLNRNISDEIVISLLTNALKPKGFTLTAVHEILDGYDKNDIGRMAKYDLEAVSKHTKLLYFIGMHDVYQFL